MFHLSYLEVTSVVMSKQRTDMVTTLASLLDCTPELMTMANWTERTAPLSFHIIFSQADGPREWDKRITHVEKHIWRALVDAEDASCSVVALYWRREFPLLLHVGPTTDHLMKRRPSLPCAMLPTNPSQMRANTLKLQSMRGRLT